ncbi:RNA-directed DNA polymerase, eukaryota, reverse transcriptase zinc-binding domain protein [Tanacetum coccineum]
MIRTLLVSTKPLPSTVQLVQSMQAERSGVGVDTAYPRTEVTTDIEATTDRAGNSTCNSSVSNTTATPTGVTPLINTTATSTVETNIGGVECERCQNASANKNRGVKVSNEPVNEFPSSYATKLSPTSLTKANLQKHEANVPQDVDYDIWLHGASVHEGRGLNIGSLRAKNWPLLGKWRWRFKKEGGNFWARVIKSIYGANGGLVDGGGRGLGMGGRGVWCDIAKVGSDIDEVGIDFTSSFVCIRGVGWRIKEGGTMESGNGNGIGCGSLEGERLETEVLTRMVEEKTLALGSSRQETMWNKLVPKKVNIFVWRALRGRLPVRVELDKRRVDLDSLLCPCCNNVVESCEHSLVLCSMAMGVWEKNFSWWRVGSFNVFTISEIFAFSGSVIIPNRSSLLWQAKFNSKPLNGLFVDREKIRLTGRLGYLIRRNASWLRNGVAFGFLLLPGCSLFAPPGMRCVFWFLWSDLSILMVPVCFLLLQFEVLCCYNTVVAIL